MAEPRVGLVEHLVPTLDLLCADLIQMHASTAIDLSTWPSAMAFVEAWAGTVDDAVARETLTE